MEKELELVVGAEVELEIDVEGDGGGELKGDNSLGDNRIGVDLGLAGSIGTQGFVAGRDLVSESVEVEDWMGGGVEAEGGGWEFSLSPKGACFSEWSRAEPWRNTAPNPSTSLFPCSIRRDKSLKSISNLSRSSIVIFCSNFKDITKEIK